MKKILIIEDDIKLRKYVSQYLEVYNYKVFILSSFEDLENNVFQICPDLILLDINLPALDGFYSQWIHNMKTSVAVIELVAEKGLLNSTENDELFSDIVEEKNKFQENLEGALNMFSLEEFSKDYVPEKILLKELVKSAVNAKKRDFIYSNVFPKVQIDEDIYIYTDQKWGRYVIERVLSNSIKYSEKMNSSVYISAIKSNDKVTLIIEDEGIGIRKEDINRVFDLFFTGKIGRKNRESTGIGLYMCKLICEKLNNKIEIESVEGKGTKVIISYANRFLGLEKIKNSYPYSVSGGERLRTAVARALDENNFKSIIRNKAGEVIEYNELENIEENYLEPNNKESGYNVKAVRIISNSTYNKNTDEKVFI